MERIIRAVPRESVETIRRAYEDWNRGDLDAVRDIYASDVTASAGALWPAGDEVSGPDAIVDAFASILHMFQRSELVAERFIERGESVVVPTLWRGTLHDSDSVIEQHVVAVYTFRGEQVVHIDYCEHLEEALKRAGGPER
jgi:ketosteroid isomerase-like protein